MLTESTPKWYPVSLKVDLAENGAELYWNVDFVIWIVTEPLGKWTPAIA